VGLRELHEVFAWVTVVANGAVSAWALAANWLTSWRVPALWRCTVAAQVTIVVQVSLGVAIVAVDDLDPPQFHMFYGFLALATVGIVYSYRQQLESRRHLLYGLGGLFLTGLLIRAMTIPA
jgi:hypothetical protein